MFVDIRSEKEAPATCRGHRPINHETEKSSDKILAVGDLGPLRSLGDKMIEKLQHMNVVPNLWLHDHDFVLRLLTRYAVKHCIAEQRNCHVVFYEFFEGLDGMV